MRRGSFTERYVKCHKPGCRCAEDPAARHGPYYSLTRGVGGQTQSRWLTAEQGEVARRQVAAGQQFRAEVEAYWAACEAWADAQLTAPAAPATGQKRGSAQPSRRRPSARSRRSSGPA
ncbi:MAG: DUF6788 family protein [candidate division NC10 bacterium]